MRTTPPLTVLIDQAKVNTIMAGLGALGSKSERFAAFIEKAGGAERLAIWILTAASGGVVGTFVKKYLEPSEVQNLISEWKSSINELKSNISEWETKMKQASSENERQYYQDKIDNATKDIERKRAAIEEAGGTLEE